MSVHDNHAFTGTFTTYTVDCGTLGYVRLINATSTDVGINVDGYGALLHGWEDKTVWCQGSTDVASGTSNTYVQAVKLELPIEQGLLGLAGIVCALLVARAFNR